MNSIPQISEAEYEVMKVIWNYAPISTNDVIDKLSSTTSWSPKTIQTMLLRLVKKKVLTYEKNSRVFVYTPLVRQEDYLNKESTSFLNRFYNGALNAMVLNFLENDKLSQEEIHTLKQILNTRKEKGD
ncbi:BlaI/MecI/CopY family transcriptional regulator [Cellulosilyticum sp. ST5]|uniref:Transcriptional repressor, CopY family n=1 Tax=Cellulosilyticum lentocellum (strain ATCC 49066 / DSM 5427 / NCIMB 11756 / RHM5) TaxID=642492 RepID=F2JLR6_CELLD|nr:BlaI/MecI/CopY family transcriptional regulator [Cellulosilyticum lentocellum]ADZ84592.1 transcriptional repressor, CopY family [Cellulosilyticum lentocellum DSM 5427]